VYAPPRSSALIVRPECPKCGTEMMLARIMPEGPGEERRTFECPMCEHSESALLPVGVSVAFELGASIEIQRWLVLLGISVAAVLVSGVWYRW
jgi:hypothetical protein